MYSQLHDNEGDMNKYVTYHSPQQAQHGVRPVRPRGRLYAEELFLVPYGT